MDYICKFLIVVNCDTRICFFMKTSLRVTIASTFSACLVGISLHAQGDFSSTEIKTTNVSGNVYMLEGAGGNIGVCVGDDGILIIDNQFAPLAPKIEAALAELQAGPVNYVLNTHLHGDHTGGNQHFGGKDATIVAHDHVHDRLSSNEGYGAAGLPAITFSESTTLHFNGETIRLLHYGPGHTDGDIIVKFENANVIHMGDLLFNGRFPYVDLRNGGSVTGYISAVENALMHADMDTKIIPGHGALAVKADLENSLRMIRETSAIIAKGIAAGKSVDELKAAGLPDEWDSFSGGFIGSEEEWIEILYNDATK